jgi:hypothetical protein
MVIAPAGLKLKRIVHGANSLRLLVMKKMQISQCHDLVHSIA